MAERSGKRVEIKGQRERLSEQRSEIGRKENSMREKR